MIPPFLFRLLLRKFRIPPANPVVWQLGLVEREISEILRGYLCHQSPSPTTSKKGRSISRTSKIPQREIGPDDVCPICQDDLLGSTRRITYCQFSCGKSVHVKCMKIWAEHQKSTGELALRCPLCREDFGSIMDLTSIKSSRLTGSDQSYQHLGTTCSHCHVCPIVGKCYKCTTCACYHLCHDCFSSNQVHLLHSFHFRQVRGLSLLIKIVIKFSCYIIIALQSAMATCVAPLIHQICISFKWESLLNPIKHHKCSPGTFTHGKRL